MRRLLFVVICFAFISIPSLSQPSSAGDIMFVAYNSDGNDGFSFVTLVDLPNSTTINFSENAWDGSVFSGSEAEYQWENNTGSTINAGKVISISDLGGTITATTGTVSKLSGTGNLANSGEILYSYTGNEIAPGTFLSAISNVAYGGTDLTNTGLASGTTAIDLSAIDTGADVANYIGTTVFNGTQEEVYTTIATVNETNWESWDETGDQSANYNPPFDFTGSALPVELTSFNAEFVDNAVQLDWETATEVNNAGFEVERQNSESGTQNSEWEVLTFVPGQGTKNSPTSYSFTDNDLPNTDNVSYRLKQIDIDGNYDYSKVVEVDLSAITGVEDEKRYTFALEQNYPNPFNPVTTINYTIPNVVDAKLASGTNAKLIVYNMLGQQVRTLVNEVKPAGNYQVQFDGSNLPSGIYFYTLSYGEFLQTRKLVLLK